LDLSDPLILVGLTARQWTRDTSISAKARFATMTKVSSLGVDPARKFGSAQTRALPGTPLAVERLRQRLVDANGHAAMQASRHAQF